MHAVHKKIQLAEISEKKKIEMGDCCEFVGLNFLSFLFGFLNGLLKYRKDV